MKITFFGATRTVTGSKHLVSTFGYNLLLDCGFYQGDKKESDKLNRTLPFSASDIDAVILTHAHLDHCGSLPTLVKNGFSGKIYCTAATAEIARLILLNSAGIQKSDSENKKTGLIAENAEPVLPIYTAEDVEAAVKHFEIVPYFSSENKWTKLNANIRFKFYEAGHVLGSVSVLLEITENSTVKRLAYSGDLGRDELPILRSPEMIAEDTPTLIMECTYGGRNHRPVDEVAQELKTIINQSYAQKSRIIAPAFALGRTQELIYILHKLANQKAIPALPIYLDSPLAMDITRVFRRYTHYFDEQYWRDFGNDGELPFSFMNLIYVKSVEESKAINTMQLPFIVIAASGMAEGGRILHHLKHNIGDTNNVILITGYQAENTLGRRILDGVTPVRIYDRFYDMRAKVIALDELSAHAGQKELLAYAKAVKGLNNLYLVHGELPQAEAFKELAETSLPQISVSIPELGQSVDI